MSTTERYGTLVWIAINELEDELEDDAWGWHTAKSVGERAGVSTNTARKYLKMLVAKKEARCIGTRRAEFFQPLR